MAYPQYNPFGTPYTGNPFTEGVDAYGTQGLWRSHGTQGPYVSPGHSGGGGSGYWYQAPHEPGLLYEPSAAEPVHWIAGGQPRQPTRFDWRAAPTPAPSSGPVVDEPAGGLGRPHGETRPGPKKARPRQEAARRGLLFAYEDGIIYGGY